MQAIILSGGKQYRVAEGQTIKLEKLPLEVGKTVVFDHILMLADGNDIKLGAPYIDGAKVSAEVINQGRHDKIRIIKFRRRKHHMKHMGHRQYYTEVKITDIKAKTASEKAAAVKESEV